MAFPPGIAITVLGVRVTLLLVEISPVQNWTPRAALVKCSSLLPPSAWPLSSFQTTKTSLTLTEYELGFRIVSDIVLPPMLIFPGIKLLHRGTFVSVGEGVMLGVTVFVTVGDRVRVGDRVMVGESVIVGVWLGVGEKIGVGVKVLVGVSVGVFVGV